MTATPPAPRPQTVAELAHNLGVLNSTLWRALRNDPAAPKPADHNHRGAALYDPDQVTEWWPRRRGRGAQPRSAD